MGYDLKPGFFDDFVGIPWLRKGRGLNGCDCWGLIRLPYLKVGITLPTLLTLYDTPRDPALATRFAEGKGEWGKVVLGTEEPLDLIMLWDRPLHVGMVVRPGLMLHMPEGETSVVEQYTTGRYSRRLEGIYRYPK